ncbi:bifunctional adenosylcobinamide kinase/adenosylcobinamide-phosphate guanylyltransferase [Roseibium porphyridii]|uniref:Bifunctional adenosylcobalamin biosynthesis protein n=1 Tax=Roseibium porphyridii TaxID=2866279 RepID=A0ABY8F4K9_9HYPH|nr:bifunctional adenosylcobinamide kinase/adenosylcobinamide-phosphate guanylyltransferase [Roseibium sp. KMA01]WFE87663.1 bifunctional adenosylcobinamide kinase/adenosylcobinamide-phosphate guanylyltransferase [Roseibium sp. KMA01]
MTHKDTSRATLVLGGARSGKSRFAEHIVAGAGLDKIYIATGAAFDAEMESRIDAHRNQRGPSWKTIEEQTDLSSVLQRECLPNTVVLVDCLTLWLSNLYFAERDVVAETAHLCEVVASLQGPCVFVSNEVGMGIVPENRLSRSFRDAQGRLNQDMAKVCETVVFVAAGLPMILKPNSQPDIKL